MKVYSSTTEFSVPDEIGALPPEDQLPPKDEFAGASASVREERSGKRRTLAKLRALMPVAAAVAAVSVVLSSFGSDPLGRDFLVTDGAAARAPASSGQGVNTSAPQGSGSHGAAKKTPVDLPQPEGKINYVYHVKYAPDGGKHSGECDSEAAMYSNVRAWLNSRGGDPESAVPYDYKLTYNGYEASPDLIIVGDPDNIDNAYIAQGSITKKYTLEVWFEGYGK